MFKLTDQEKKFVLETYLDASFEVDNMPYTNEFDWLHGSFIVHQRPVAKALFWRELLSMRKSKRYGPKMRRHPGRRS